ncbi:conserved hypothetical protein [Burkholderiales bacterium 8X]|nr:conserved hypothetical protein [Burkholderiales bacterium 8X]
MPSELVKRAIFHCARRGAEPGDLAEAVIGALRPLHAELTLVVGAQAASALFAHAVHRTRAAVGWTVPTAEVMADTMFDALRDDLANRTLTDGLSAGEFLLSTLVDHLVSLIGQPLTRRLLHSAWSAPDADYSSEESLQ